VDATGDDVATAVRDSVLGGAEIRFMSSAVRSEYRSVFSSGNYEEMVDFSLNALGQVVFVKRAAGPLDRIVFVDVRLESSKAKLSWPARYGTLEHRRLACAI
jgi:hypothetical protein